MNLKSHVTFCTFSSVQLYGICFGNCKLLSPTDFSTQILETRSQFLFALNPPVTCSESTPVCRNTIPDSEHNDVAYFKLKVPVYYAEMS